MPARSIVCSLLYFTLVLSVAGPARAQTVALAHANIVDVVGLSVLEDQTVVIDGERIAAILPSAQWQQSAGQVTIDLSGKYLIPGLIDAHVHLATDPEKEDRETLTLQRLRGLLRGGVTAVRDMGGDARVLAGLKRRAEIDLITAPDIYYSAIVAGRSFFSDPRTVSSSKGRVSGDVDWMRAVDDATDYDKLAIRAQGAGATGLKVYADVTPGQLEKTVAAARKQGMPVWSHAYHRQVSPSQVAAAGVDVLSHAAYLAADGVDDFARLHRGGEPLSAEALSASFERSRYDGLFDRLRESGALLDTTLSVFELTRKAEQPLSAREILFRYSVQFARWANEAGIPLVAGTDAASDIAGLPFPVVHYELQLLVEAVDLTPLQALQTATLNAARALALEADLGSVTTGKIANLVVLDDNPVESIAHTRSVAHVIKHGRFVYRGEDPRLPFSTVRAGGGMLWLSGQIGNLPGTMTLADDSTVGQMHQAMRNIGQVLEDYGLQHDDLVKCTLMLADIDEWGAVSEVYKQYFNPPLPARSAFAASGLALGAGVEVECMAPWAGTDR